MQTTEGARVFLPSPDPTPKPNPGSGALPPGCAGLRPFSVVSGSGRVRRSSVNSPSHGSHARSYLESISHNVNDLAADCRRTKKGHHNEDKSLIAKIDIGFRRRATILKDCFLGSQAYKLVKTKYTL